MSKNKDEDNTGKDAGTGEQHSPPLLRLKNGVEENAAEVIHFTVLLRGYLSNPQSLNAVLQLQKMIQGLAAEPNPEIIADFEVLGRQLQLLDGNGKPRPIIRAIMESAFRITPDGPVIVDPWVSTPENLEALKQGAATTTEWVRRGLRKLDDFLRQGGDDTPGWDR